MTIASLVSPAHNFGCFSIAVSFLSNKSFQLLGERHILSYWASYVKSRHQEIV